MSIKINKKTKREVLSRIYYEFYIEINELCNIESIFPDIHNIDMCDIMFLINNYFGLSTNYKSIILELFEINNIKLEDDKLEKAIVIITNFLNLFKSV